MRPLKDKGKPASIKHVPQRTCIACREEKGKKQLSRLVQTAEGKVEIDPTWTRSGRGAYLCPNSVCWGKGLSKQHLDRALRTSISPQNRRELTEYGKRFVLSLAGPEVAKGQAEGKNEHGDF